MLAWLLALWKDIKGNVKYEVLKRLLVGFLDHAGHRSKDSARIWRVGSEIDFNPKTNFV